jgi:hypothetical protein
MLEIKVMYLMKRNAPMIQAVLNSKNAHNNELLNPNSPSNRDNCLEPYRLIAQLLKDNGINLVTADLLTEEPLFELQIERQEKTYSDKKFLIQLENPEHAVLPRSTDSYRSIYSWNDELYSTLESFVKVYIPSIDDRLISQSHVRDIEYVMICANKKFSKENNQELYSDRLSIIDWFSQNNSTEFRLYGRGWVAPTIRDGWRSLLRSVLSPVSTPKVFHGEVISKSDILSRSNFSFCYENMRSDGDYITEKIFDSMLAGCVPIYLGSSRISDYIPDDVYIDAREFNGVDAIYRYIEKISFERLCDMRRSIVDFLESKQADNFRNTVFANCVVTNILERLDDE